MNDPIIPPTCRPEDLGRPIPDCTHAVSVCLPEWAHNVSYEEGDAAVIEKMQCGYPRFFLHPLVARLFTECASRFAGDDEFCFAWPSRRTAERCVEFVHRHTGYSGTIHHVEAGGVWAVSLPNSARETAMSFWQHAGEIVSSRLAEAVLQSQPPTSDGNEEKRRIRERIAVETGGRPEDVYLFPTGMAAIFCAYRAFQKLRPNGRSVQFGFPYVDSLKVQQKFGPNSEPDDNVHFFPNGNADDFESLSRLLQIEETLGLFCEIPCNPLLNTPDVNRLSELALEHGVPFHVDDTLGALININALPVADVLATSLTKYFSGSGDVMGGCLVLNAQRPLCRQLKDALEQEYEDLLFAEDAIVLERNSRDFRERVLRINQNAERVCDFLQDHPLVERIDFPKYSTPETYRQFLKDDGGYGGLFSLLLCDAPNNAPAFFDALGISKGPNLGTNFSLCCPYTLLAHYRELEFVESCGISRYLLRVSVGLEDPDWLIARFTEALTQIAG